MNQGTKSYALGLCAAAAVSACAPEVEAPQDNAARPAVFYMVEASSNLRRSEFPAVVSASRSTQLAFEVGGRVEALNVVESSQVKQGDVIAQINQQDYINKVTQARSEYQNAESEYQRARRLAEQNAIATNVVESRKAQRDIAQAGLDTAQKALDDTTLRAPYDGNISTVSVKQFQNVQPLEIVATLQSDGVEAIINVPARIVAFSQQFTPVSTNVVLDVAPDIAIPATFKEASTEADPNTQTYEVRFSFEPPEDLIILPGMTATVRTEAQAASGFDDDEDRVSVPRAAIVAEGEIRFVWVVDPDSMQVEKRTVTIDEGLGDVLSVSAGLETGEIIVAAGGSFLHEGMQVRPWEE
jgi:RND family efflux transporter MFP subunit